MASNASPLRHSPNLITGLRILLLPVFAWLVHECGLAVESGGSGLLHRVWATSVMAVIAVGDVADGWLARRYGWHTRLGAVLDPLADKLAQVTGLVLFTFFASTAFTPLPWFVLAAIVGRDVLLGVGSLVLWKRGVLDVQPGRTGKLATFVTFLLLLVVSAGAAPILVWPLSVLSCLLVVASGAIYVRAGFQMNRRPGAVAPQSRKPGDSSGKPTRATPTL